MEDKKEIVLMPCRCTDPHPVVAKIKAGLYIVACRSCPTHARGNTEAEARKAWNAEVQK